MATKLRAFLPEDIVANAALFQVAYGASIVAFLGAVHWGAALTSTLGGPIAVKIAHERYLWGVLPSLLAFPLPLMEPGPAAALLSVLLPVTYLVDARFTRLGYLPQFYMKLRGPLTLLATFGTLTTASYYYHQELERVQELDKRATAAAVADAAADAPAA